MPIPVSSAFAPGFVPPVSSTKKAATPSTSVRKPGPKKSLSVVVSDEKKATSSKLAGAAAASKENTIKKKKSHNGNASTRAPSKSPTFSPVKKAAVSVSSDPLSNKRVQISSPHREAVSSVQFKSPSSPLQANKLSFAAALKKGIEQSPQASKQDDTSVSTEDSGEKLLQNPPRNPHNSTAFTSSPSSTELSTNQEDMLRSILNNSKTKQADSVSSSDGSSVLEVYSDFKKKDGTSSAKAFDLHLSSESSASSLESPTPMSPQESFHSP
jgi:hypothetical protein